MGLVDTATDVTTLGELPALGPLLVDAATSALPDVQDLPGLDRLPGIDRLPGFDRARRRTEAPATEPAGTTPGDEAGAPADLPSRAVTTSGIEVAVADVADYADVCRFRLDSRVPVTWPHLLGFPLGMWLMTREDFPHAVLGLVHVRNRIRAHDHVRVGEVVDVAAMVADQRPHARGVQFDVRVEVTRDDELVWESTSTYLRRGSSPEGDVPDEGGPDVDAADLPLTGRWSLGADLGRRYAEVSGDRNPIHLSAVTARAFGFPRAIAHGMWTKAAALAGLGTLPRPVEIDVVFRKPVLLPSTPVYATRRTDDGWHFALRRDPGRCERREQLQRARRARPHLVGTAIP